MKLGSSGPLRLAILLAAGVVALQDWLRYQRFNRFDLPDFDPWAYLAMTEQPSYFSIAPWGYRVLKAWVVHHVAFSPASYFGADRFVNALGLTIAGVLLFVFLRRLGHGAWASLAGVVVLGLSRPFAALFEEPFLTDAFSLPLFIGLLVAIEMNLGVAVLALLVLVGTLTKELFILVIPLACFFEYERNGRRAAAVTLLWLGLPALALSLILRHWWVGRVFTPHAPVDLDVFKHIWFAVEHGWQTAPETLFLYGLLPVAALGALRRRAWPYVLRYGYLCAITVALPVIAWTNTPHVVAKPFYVPRHVVYAVPLLLPLALLAVDRFLPHWSAPALAPSRPSSKALSRLAVAGIAICLVAPFFTLTPYQRAPLHRTLVAPYVLTVCRASLRTARGLEAGEEIVWDVDRDGWLWGESPPEGMGKMRWYLWEGWGLRPWNGHGEIRMRDDAASFLLPVLAPASVDIEISLSTIEGALLELAVNDHTVSRHRLAPGRSVYSARIPAEVLFRGDNLATLRRWAGAGSPQLHKIVLRAATSSR